MMRKQLRVMSETEKAWIAGILDGEGCLTLMKAAHGKFSPRLKVNNTDPRMLVRLRDITGVGGIYLIKMSKTHRKQAWDWTVSSQQALAVVRAIRPYLVVKGEQADTLLAYRGLRDKSGSEPITLVHQEWLYRRLQELKHELPSLDDAQGHKPQSEEVR